jgi:hypothetical protein
MHLNRLRPANIIGPKCAPVHIQTIRQKSIAGVESNGDLMQQVGL